MTNTEQNQSERKQPPRTTLDFIRAALGRTGVDVHEAEVEMLPTDDEEAKARAEGDDEAVAQHLDENSGS